MEIVEGASPCVSAPLALRLGFALTMGGLFCLQMSRTTSCWRWPVARRCALKEAPLSRAATPRCDAIWGQPILYLAAPASHRFCGALTPHRTGHHQERRKATERLRDTIKAQELALPLLILIAQQRTK